MRDKEWFKWLRTAGEILLLVLAVWMIAIALAWITGGGIT